MAIHEYIGIDVAKNKFDVYLQPENGSPKQGQFNNNQAGFEAFLAWVKQHTHSPWIGMEATGHYSELLADFLVS